MKASDLSDWLESIERDSKLTPAEVIEHARDPESPGHGFFEWDDGKAAHQHRLEQARQLLARRVVIETESYQVTVPRYVRDPEAASGEQSYVNVRSISDADLRHQILATEFSRVAQMLSRTRELAKAFGLMDEVDEVVSRLRLMREQVQAPTTRM